jgi:hypothetical protein
VIVVHKLCAVELVVVEHAIPHLTLGSSNRASLEV